MSSSYVKTPQTVNGKKSNTNGVNGSSVTPSKTARSTTANATAKDRNREMAELKNLLKEKDEELKQLRMKRARQLQE